MFSSVRAPRVYEHIVQQVERAIFDGRLRSGDRLPPERELVRQFRASRVAVREALRTLEHRGLVDVRHGSCGGHFVRDADAGLLRRDLITLLRLARVSVAHVMEARLLIEPELAALAADRATELELKALGAVLDERAALTATGGQPRPLDIGFHRLVAAAAKNPLHAALSDALMDLEPDVAGLPTKLTAEDQAQVALAHRGILDAIATREVARARAAMRTHVVDVQQRLVRRAREEAS